jgi:Tfp pilus assembly protein PilV
MQIDLKPASNQFSRMHFAQAQEFARVPAAISRLAEGLSGEKMNTSSKESRQSGFSMLELIVVLAMSLTVGAIGVVAYQRIATYLRAAGDQRDLNGIVAQAKMDAAANFSHARAYADLNANTFHLEIWNKAGSPAFPAGCWQTVGDAPANPCTVVASPVYSLSTGNAFGFGAITTPPPNTQAAIAQAAVCTNNTGGNIANTACILFNSRGIPINAAGNPDGTGAFYVTNGSTVFGLTVRATGSALNWSISNSASSTTWMHQ